MELSCFAANTIELKSTFKAFQIALKLAIQPLTVWLAAAKPALCHNSQEPKQRPPNKASAIVASVRKLEDLEDVRKLTALCAG